MQTKSPETLYRNKLEKENAKLRKENLGLLVAFRALLQAKEELEPENDLDRALLWTQICDSLHLIEDFLGRYSVAEIEQKANKKSLEIKMFELANE